MNKTQHVLPKWWYLFTNLSGITSRKTLANLFSGDIYADTDFPYSYSYNLYQYPLSP